MAGQSWPPESHGTIPIPRDRQQKAVLHNPVGLLGLNLGHLPLSKLSICGTTQLQELPWLVLESNSTGISWQWGHSLLVREGSPAQGGGTVT